MKAWMEVLQTNVDAICFHLNMIFDFICKNNKRKANSNFSFVFIHSSLIQYIPTTASPSPPSLLPGPLSQIQFVLPVISTKHTISRCSKMGHKPSYQGWKGQPSRRKRGPVREKSQRHLNCVSSLHCYLHQRW